ncbi:putative DNA binding domain-containing protein, partial [bacterium]|nr:putative DNA binding domain-containing protein [bacterium]
MLNNIDRLQLITSEGEGQTIEFKEKPSNLDKEMVAFANAMGGSVFIGISDTNEIKGIEYTNKMISQIQDTARNCDPPIKIRVEKYPGILEVIISEGTNKPYRCQSGFYLRTGPNSQKLTRDEIINFAIGEGRIRFDEQYNPHFEFNKNFSNEQYLDFLNSAKITANISPEDVLLNIGAAEKQKNSLLFTNAAVLFFSLYPQDFFPEAYITCIRYRGNDRVSIIDRKDMKGPLIPQLKSSIDFFKRHTEEAIFVPGNLKHDTIEEYPTVAIREALINAVMHRDYLYDSSHIYMHIYSDRIEIENPGGLFKGLTVADLGKRSVRRNRLIAELFFRSGYIEMVGSGINRMFNAMKENGNPEPEIQSTNFFNIMFKKGFKEHKALLLTERQKKLLSFIITT